MSRPISPGSTRRPSSAITSTTTPGTGFCPEPAFSASCVGNGAIMCAPVSVCHQVSTMGAVPEPMTSRYQRHASGLIGSPTEPSSRIEERSWRCGISRPDFMKPRIAVGAA